eukprot:5688342-Prymnesium_polylepis.1
MARGCSRGALSCMCGVRRVCNEAPRGLRTGALSSEKTACEGARRGPKMRRDVRAAHTQQSRLAHKAGARRAHLALRLRQPLDRVEVGVEVDQALLHERARAARAAVAQHAACLRLVERQLAPISQLCGVAEDKWPYAFHASRSAESVVAHRLSGSTSGRAAACTLSSSVSSTIVAPASMAKSAGTGSGRARHTRGCAGPRPKGRHNRPHASPVWTSCCDARGRDNGERRGCSERATASARHSHWDVLQRIEACAVARWAVAH